MLIYTKEQIRDWDTYTIHAQNITSLALMERAAHVFYSWFVSIYYDKSKSITVVAGPGNNGGDSLAVARFLHEDNYNVNVYLLRMHKNLTKDCAINLQLVQEANIPIEILDDFRSIDIPENSIVIDGLFGTGLTKPLKAAFADYINWINESDAEVVSIDISSGVDADMGMIGPSIIANRTLSFEIPKLSFFLHECQESLGNWDYRSINLSTDFVTHQPAQNFLITREFIVNSLIKRRRISSKYNFGFAQLCGGSKGMIGAMILAARAAIKSGVGRLILSAPTIYHSVLFGASPIAMMDAEGEHNDEYLSSFSVANSQISALACGPGLGTSESAVQYIDQLLTESRLPTILDADALNIISRQNWQTRIPANSILTPHEKEFERLFGECINHKSRIERQREISKKHSMIIILKGAYTSISTPEGKMFFNANGNVGMATAGSGDVLTGIVLSLLAQRYSPAIASIMGVFIHGSAGDLAAENYGEIGMTAEDIIEYIPQVFKNIYGK